VRAAWPELLVNSPSSSYLAKRPRHGDPSAQADGHRPHFQGASICQPAAATCQAAHSRWLCSSVPARLRCSWLEGDQEHLRWGATAHQRTQHQAIVSRPKARVPETPTKCKSIRLVVRTAAAGMPCFRSLRRVWRRGATVRPEKLCVWFRLLSSWCSVLSVVDHLHPAGHALSAVAGNNKLFLKHNNAPIFEGYSLKQTIELLSTVQEALATFTACRSQYGDDWLAAQGLECGLEIDALFIANYEHLLLRLQAELVQALTRKAFEELLRGGHDKKQRKLLAWFTEFADKPQPLSTSFPWTIKASLAVLWGVCWMFYGNDASDQGDARVRQERLLQHIVPWSAPASSDCKFVRRWCALSFSPQQRFSANSGRRELRPRADWRAAATLRAAGGARQRGA
jgi:hypothetical protein